MSLSLDLDPSSERQRDPGAAQPSFCTLSAAGSQRRSGHLPLLSVPAALPALGTEAMPLRIAILSLSLWAPLIRAPLASS